ncbi:MAG: acyl-ACP--UDP-N-acetylglucosamine O-acyltransferase [Alphaproteobacteria bacterium]
MKYIHPTAIIEKGAEIPENVHIGPYCHIGPNVVLKDQVHLVSHVSLAGFLTIGEYTKIYPFASIGHPPQDLKYQGEESKTVIGLHTTIREYVTIQPGTKRGGMLTSVGSRCLLMVGVHIAHDCTIKDHVILANNAALAGHVVINEHAIIGGLSAIKQFVHIGPYAMIGGMSGVEKDVIPYGLVVGERAHLRGINIVGLKRHNFPQKTIKQLLRIYETIFVKEDDLPLHDRAQTFFEQFKDDDDIKLFFNFIKEAKNRSLCLPKPK